MSRWIALFRRHLPGADGRHDGALLASYLAGDNEAFAELVRRHGPLVWGVCRRQLDDAADAEDAFQAVFLVLWRRAARLTGSAAVGPWLYRVAVWTTRNARRKSARRSARRVSLPADAADRGTPADLDRRLDLDAALLALPERYRTPVVLFHLQGWSRRELAAHLGCPEGTLSALLSRGLARLRKRLAGREPGALLALAAAATAPAAPRVAPPLTAAANAAALSLARGVLRMFWFRDGVFAGAAALAILGAGAGIGRSSRPAAEAPAAVANLAAAEPDGRTPALPAAPADRAGERPDRQLPAENALNETGEEVHAVTPEDSPPALRELAGRLTRLLKTACPDARVELDGNDLTVRRRTRKFMVHGVTKTGAFLDAREQEGPDARGFLLVLTLHPDRPVRATPVPLERDGPYWKEFADDYPVGPGTEWVSAYLTYNRDAPRDVLDRVKACLRDEGGRAKRGSR